MASRWQSCLNGDARKKCRTCCGNTKSYVAFELTSSKAKLGKTGYDMTQNIRISINAIAKSRIWGRSANRCLIMMSKKLLLLIGANTRPTHLT